MDSGQAAGGDDAPTSSASPGFAPRDLSDGRSPGHWNSRYELDARRQIRIEGFILGSLIIVAIGVTFFMCVTAQTEEVANGELKWGLDQKVRCYAAAVAAGYLGGALFAAKWLYHSVAKHTWNLDRRTWRFMSPILSSGLALLVVVMAESGLLAALNQEFVRKAPGASSLAFLVGYFSDKTLAKLTDVADSIFGDK